MDFVYYLFVGFLLSLFGAWCVFKYGFRFNIIDTPCSRSSHSRDIPKGGGIGILFSFLVLSIALDMPFIFWGPSCLISIVGFQGDRKELPVNFRLFIQILCGLCILITYEEINSVHSIVIIAFFLIYIIGTTNIFNFMDGIDGIAGITAVVAFSSLAIYALLSGSEKSYIIICTGIALSSCAFLFFNFPIAKVFMGDVGSVLLGFIFSSLVVIFSDSALDFICMAGFLSLFYFDSISTMILRLFRGESLSIPHRQHVYQLLANELGIRHWKVSIVFGVIQAFISLIILVLRSRMVSLIVFFCVLLVTLFIFSINIREKVIRLNENQGF